MNLGVERYLCTTCGGNFILDSVGAQEDESVREGELVCRFCGIHYPVIDGIPRFVPAENYAGSFGHQWNIHRKTQLDSYTGLPLSRNRLFEVTGWPENMVGQTILEAGSGAGRFTEILISTGADVYSFDYSNAIDANAKNNGKADNLHLFQGDIFNIPLRPEWFDKVFCIGVLQHTPDPEGAFFSLTKSVRPGGELVIDCYNKSLLSLLQCKYVLRPITKRMEKEKLDSIIQKLVSVLLPLAITLKKIIGRFGARLLPIVEYSNLGLPYEVNLQWSLLDTFDMYSPAHDHPQSLSTVRRWFTEARFFEINVRRGPNGVVGIGRKPLSFSKGN